MARQMNKPDFIVDQFGSVEDVRQQKTGDVLPSSGDASTHAPRSVRTNVFSPNYRPYLYLVLVGVIIALFLIFSYSNKKLQTTTSNSRHFFNTAEILFDNQEFDKAINSYTQAIQLDSKFGQAYNNRGLAYHILGKYDNALADFNLAVEILPTSP